MPTIVEIKPDKTLIERDFEGYKLSLEEIPKGTLALPTPVHRILPSQDQYSYKHAKLFSLHNHLKGETFGELDILYYIGDDRQVFKIQTDPYGAYFDDPLAVWRIPQVVPQNVYNMCLALTNDKYAVVTDGASLLYIVDTGVRTENVTWKTVFSDSFNFNFVIESVGFNDCKGELHCLLHEIISEDGCHKSRLYWVKYRTSDDLKWEQVEITQLKSKGDIHYTGIETACSAIYLASTHPFIEDKATSVSSKKYIWSQNERSILLKCKVGIDKDVKVVTGTQELSIMVEGEKVLSGRLYKEIDADFLHPWKVNNGILELVITKKDDTEWNELIVGDSDGEYAISDSLALEEVHRKLAHLTSDQIPPSETTILNDGEKEECDFPSNDTCFFERIANSETCTHKSNLGSHLILFNQYHSDANIPALVIQYNEDALLYQPEPSDEGFNLKHVGTLSAFGYIQASKQRKKFLTCSPDLSYSVVCESSRHIFIYRQNKAVMSGELRNRTEGRRVRKIAQQQVIDLTDEDVVGIYASNTRLFILTNKTIFMLVMS